MSQDTSPYLSHFQKRVMQDALAEATQAYWLRRAGQFDAARHRDGDFIGEASPEEMAQRDAGLLQLTETCRRRAAVRASLGTEWWRSLMEELL